MRALVLYILVFVSPLVFFTDLTRNPFCFQQFLFSLCLFSVCVFFFIKAIRNKQMCIPNTAADFPLLVFAAICVLSLIFSYFGHKPFFRPSILNSAYKEILFILSSCLPVFYLSARQSDHDESMPEYRACLRYNIFIPAWLFMWCLFPFLRSGEHVSVLGKIFDPYGTLLFIVAFVFIRSTVSGGTRNETLRLVSAAAVIASVYGIFQFFGGEVIWNRHLDPYGNRPVSTFGNPNFLSSFVVMLLPFAWQRLIFAEKNSVRIFYGLAVFSYTGVLMCSMARSSWIGTAAAMSIMFYYLFKLKNSNFHDIRHFLPDYTFVRRFSLAILLFVVLFPSGAGNFKPLIAGRIADLFSGILPSVTALSDNENHVSQGIDEEDIGNSDKIGHGEYSAYGRHDINISVYQRLIMWAGAWQMGSENPFLGKGFAQFEPFNAFYQGRLLASFPVFRFLRTHANEAHNEIAQLWAETGIAGLGAAIFVLIVFARLFKNKMVSICDNPDVADEKTLLFIPLAAGIAGMIVDNMANVSIHFLMPAALFCYISGAFVAETGGVRNFKFTGVNKLRALYSILIVLCIWAAYSQLGILMREISYFAGYKAFAYGKAMEAASLMEKAIRHDSTDVNVFYELANIKINLADFVQAEKYFIMALNTNAGYDEIYSNISVALAKQNRLAEALPYINVATFINPYNPMAWNTMGKIYAGLPASESNLSAAKMAYDEAIRLYPEDPAYSNILGYLYSNADKYEKSAEILETAVRTHPENQILRENFLLSYSKSGKGKDTADWLKKYSRFSEILGSFLDNAPVEKTEPALADLEKFIEENPNDIVLHEMKGKYLFKLKRYNAAAAEMKKVLDYMPGNANIRYGLAVIYETSGKKDQALVELKYILEQEPENKRAAAKKAKLEKNI